MAGHVAADEARFSKTAAASRSTSPPCRCPKAYKPTPQGPMPRIESMDFHPKFADYDVVIGNYIGPRWPEEDGARLREVRRERQGLRAGPFGRQCVSRLARVQPHVWRRRLVRPQRKVGPARLSRRRRPSQSAIRRPAPAAITVRNTNIKSQSATRSTPSRAACRPLGCTRKTNSTTPCAARPRTCTSWPRPTATRKFEGTGKHEPMLMVLPYGAGGCFTPCWATPTIR